MRRRLAFLSLYVLAGCASPANKPLIPTPALPPPTPAPAEPASIAPPPGDRLPVRPPTASGDIGFDKWSADFYSRALRAGIAPALLERELAGLTPDPRVESLDGKQPEFSKPVGDYIKGTVTDGRANLGRQKAAAIPSFPQIERTSGVPREILVGIWAMESGFGSIQGDFDVVRSMATLAAEGRRRQFAEDQLIAALKIIGSGEFPRERLRGSWAGAMGQTQFIPTTFLSTAVDGDGDGKRDIWGSSADALASAANLLDKGGWAAGQTWAREVTVPAGFDWSLSEGPKMTPAEWEKAGVKRADGLPWSAADQPLGAQLAPRLPAVSQPLRDPQVQQLAGLCARRRPAGRPRLRHGTANPGLAGRDALVAGRPHDGPAGARRRRLRSRRARWRRGGGHPQVPARLAEGAGADGRRLSVARRHPAPEGRGRRLAEAAAWPRSPPIKH
jgi:membrane-bound lytic murein transglycosylase B